MEQKTIPSDIILSLNNEAQILKKQGVDVLNGTIGMMYDDEGHLPAIPQLRESLTRHNQDEDLTYAAVTGDPLYNQELLNWFFDCFFDDRKEFIKPLATVGGTGAVNIAMRDCCDENTTVLIPYLSWPNYVTIAKLYRAPFIKYDNFRDGRFNVEGLKENLEKVTSEGKRATVIINDPCHNPTGYIMKQEDWDALIALLNLYKDKVSFILDVAYIDYSKKANKQRIAEALRGLSSEIVTYICMSFSKTFSFYGLRIGALAIYCNDSSKVLPHFNSCKINARATWSSPNHMAMNVISEVLADKDNIKSLRHEIKENRIIVEKRAKIFFDEAKEVGLVSYPYEQGFFVSLPVPDALSLVEKLKEKRVYLVPVANDVVRIAFSCIPTRQMSGLAKLIKENM